MDNKIVYRLKEEMHDKKGSSDHLLFHHEYIHGTLIQDTVTFPQNSFIPKSKKEKEKKVNLPKGIMMSLSHQ